MTAPDANNQPTSSPEPLKLFGKMLTFSRIKLETADLNEINTYLETLISSTSSQIPVVIESDIEQDLEKLVELFWSLGLQPIGVVTGILDDAAKALRLAIFPSDGKRIERIRATKPSNSPSSNNIDEKSQAEANKQTANSEETIKETNQEVAVASNEDRVTSMIYDQMVRSGQSINHVGGDLIITNSVNNGAEVITDNSLHVYGRAHGRLVAGATGDKDARIFCHSFNPSLVSVAGTYCLKDGIPEEFIDKPVQVKYIEEKGLVFEILENI